MVRHDEVRVAETRRLSAADAALAQRLYLAEQDVRVDDHAVADDAGLGLVEDARGDEVQLELLAVAHDGVAGVVAALDSGPTTSAFSASRSVILPLPSSPHWAPITTVAGTHSPSAWVGPGVEDARARAAAGPRRSDAARRDHAGRRGLHQAAGDAGAVADGVQVADLASAGPRRASGRAE